jgi:hypothetical protein
VLLVEGQDDKHVVHHLCQSIPNIPAFSILNKGRIDPLLRSISVEIKAEGRKAVGIVVDADDDLDNRWQELSDILLNTHPQLPSSPEATGTIVEGIPRIGVWIMPDNKSTGELEDFVQTMIPTIDPVWPRSRSYVDDIPTGHRRFRPGKVLRAKLYAWLATREIPGRMGAAIGAGDLDVNVESSTEFVAWLRRLFS